MKKRPFPPAEYIDTPAALRRIIPQLAQASLLAVDTESNGMYSYQERICLIQISTRSTDYIIDPLALDDLSPLQPVLENPAIEKVFHAAEYDLMCLQRDYGFKLENIFDTMIASRICGEPLTGLGNLLAKYVGVTLDKSHQRDNWGLRPLAADNLLYAQMDTHYLPALRDILYAELEKQGRLAEALETFDELKYIEAADNRFDPEGYWQIGIPQKLNRREMAILREIYLLREQLAAEKDVPPFKIFGNKTLLALVRSTPHTHDELVSLRGITDRSIAGYGNRLLAAIRRGEDAHPPRRPKRPRTDPVIQERYNALREWRKLRAERRGVESDVIVSKYVLWELAERAPATLDDMRDIPGLGPWRLERYGDEMLQVLHQNGWG